MNGRLFKRLKNSNKTEHLNRIIWGTYSEERIWLPASNQLLKVESDSDAASLLTVTYVRSNSYAVT